ncbi:ATP-binding protein [Enterocloster citroniae]|uniref:ATP-binding protein n=1 Tax=Enterocloster citroniae TaxID=358743 RepID=UPI001D06ECA8|nr:ATP-binding protein [Enterocloster citroniae]MCB7068244.1 ATP-binding protein [Enterocloster citroniae]
MRNQENTVSVLVDELNELGLPNMAATLDTIYRSKDFLEKDRLSLISELITSEYQDKISKRYNNRLRHAKLIGCPCEIGECRDSTVREYLPNGITEVLSTAAFIQDGLNVCILGPSDSGKTYLAKALGVVACHDYKTEYHHCEMFLEDLVSLNNRDHTKFLRRLKQLSALDLLILDDFLLHTIVNESEVKMLFTVLEARCESEKSTIVCSQREPKSWASMILNDEVSANAIIKRATKHYTVVIGTKGP